MASKMSVAIISVISFFVGGLIGTAVGGYYGVELTTADFGNRWLSEQANDIDSRISNLINMRENRQDENLEAMERQLEDDLISIEPDHRIKPPTLDAINAVIQKAKEYRAAYPRTSSRPAIERMVEAVFNQAPYK